MKRNIGTIDRIMRIVTAVVIAVLFYTNVLTGTLGIVLLALAIIFAVTSLISICPIYLVLGLNTRGRKE
jgi:hypothetical protein